MIEERRELNNKLWQIVYTLEAEMREVKEGISKINDKIDKMQGNCNEKCSRVFLSKESFAPVKSIVYGMVGLLLTGIIMSILALVVKLR